MCEDSTGPVGQRLLLGNTDSCPCVPLPALWSQALDRTVPTMDACNVASKDSWLCLSNPGEALPCPACTRPLVKPVLVAA